MKNYTFFIIFLLCTMPTLTFLLKAEDTMHNSSLFTYLYTSLVQPRYNIPHAQHVKKNIIIFDLDGVLCTTNHLQVYYDIGFDVCKTYFLHHGMPTQEKLFQALHDAPAVTTQKSFHNGLQIPQIMIDWQCNAQEYKDVQHGMIQHICHNKQLTIAEKNLHIKTILMMTTPKKLIATRKLIMHAVELLHILKNLGYQLYILSNWDAASFPLLQNEFPELFTYQGKDIFDGIMISGKIGKVKPQNHAFQTFLQKFNINPEQAIFIDDTLENIQAAENLNITSIYCRYNNVHSIVTELVNKLN